MQAYHADTELKNRFVTLLEGHAAADRIVQGRYWERGRGCAVGCSIESMRQISGRKDLAHDDHAVYEEMIGVPRILARLEDGIFEGLPSEEAQSWPIRFASAIRPGADLSLVWSRFAVWLLVDPEAGVIRFARTVKQREAIQHVADLYQRQIGGEAIATSEWRAYAAAAYDAAAYAAATTDAAYDAAAHAYAAYAAAAAAHAATTAAAHAAAAHATTDAAYDAAAHAAAAHATTAAAHAAAANAARHQARIQQANYLIALLEAA
jgi:hypothetical protein